MVQRHVLTKYKLAETTSKVSNQMNDDDLIHFEACFEAPGSNAPSETCSCSFARSTSPPTNLSGNLSNCQYGIAPSGSDGSRDNTATAFPDRLIAMKGRERNKKLGLKRSSSYRNLTQSCPGHCEPALVLEPHRSCESSPLKTRPEHHCNETRTISQQVDDLGQCKEFNCPRQQFYPTQSRYFNALDAAASIRTALQKSQVIASESSCQTAAPINEGLQGGMCVSKNRLLQRLRVLNPTPNLYNSSNLGNFKATHQCRQVVPQGLATVLGPRMPLDVEFQIQMRSPQGLAAVIVDHCCVESKAHQQQEQQQMKMQEEQQRLQEEEEEKQQLLDQQQLQLLQQQQQELQKQQKRLQQQQLLLMQQQQLQNQQQQLGQLKQQQAEAEAEAEAVQCSSISVDSCSDHNCDEFQPREPPLTSSSISLDPNDDLRSLELRAGSKRKRSLIRSPSFTVPLREPNPSNEGSLHQQLEKMSFNERSLKSWESLPQDSIKGYSTSVYRAPKIPSVPFLREASNLNESGTIDAEDNRRHEANQFGSSKESMVSFNTSAAMSSGSERSTSPRRRRGNTESNIRSIVQQVVQQQLRMREAVQDVVEQELNIRSTEGESSLSENSDELLKSSHLSSRASLSPSKSCAENVTADVRNALGILDKTQTELNSKIRSQSRSKSRISLSRSPSSPTESGDGWTTVGVSSNFPRSGSLDASTSSSCHQQRSRRKSSVQPSQPVAISYEDRMASITQLLNSMNSVTQLLNSMPIQGGIERPATLGNYPALHQQAERSVSTMSTQRPSARPRDFPPFGTGEPSVQTLHGQEPYGMSIQQSFDTGAGSPQGSYSQFPGQQGSFSQLDSQMAGQQGSFSQLPGQQDNFSPIPGQQSSYTQIPGDYSQFGGQPGTRNSQILGQLPGYSIQLPMSTFNGQWASNMQSRSASVTGQRQSKRSLSRQSNMGQRKSLVPEENDDASEGSIAVQEADESGLQDQDGDQSEDLEHIEEAEQEEEQEAEQDENSSEQAEGMAATYQPNIQSHRKRKMPQLLQSQEERLNGNFQNPIPVLHTMPHHNQKTLLSTEMLTQTDKIKSYIAQMPREFQGHLVNVQSHSGQSFALFKPQTYGKRSLFKGIVYVVLEELKVLESRSRQKSAAYGLSSPTTQS